MSLHHSIYVPLTNSVTSKQACVCIIVVRMLLQLLYDGLFTFVCGFVNIQVFCQTSNGVYVGCFCHGSVSSFFHLNFGYFASTFVRNILCTIFRVLFFVYTVVVSVHLLLTLPSVSVPYLSTCSNPCSRFFATSPLQRARNKCEMRGLELANKVQSL